MPGPRDPNFDIAWEHRGELYVAEVKSITDANEERHLRLGLGQVIRYRAMLSLLTGGAVRAILVPERPPRDGAWRATCLDVGVRLVPRDELTESFLRCSTRPPASRQAARSRGAASVGDDYFRRDAIGAVWLCARARYASNRAAASASLPGMSLP